ncbi:D-amino-acid transaminase [Glacieibacterium frigidum]|uniref:Probable branched-chain-amino-acid aminotransferase n=1 Tax=Glacieibacterium frigidum TaxID=2593303 RepID=A0A552U968_9SPHN|nr:D-amino-acid transaminase [Glacieibacterium frigidum]TRW14761.1 D-amino-acid transaminase [Glacieibacterium frigidum]
MPRLAYVDGRHVPLADASVSVEDRGFQFADAVYEVCAVANGRLFDWDLHAARLTRNLSALGIAAPLGTAALLVQARRLIAANRAREALLYIQVTRGAGRRDHGFRPDRPTLVMTVRPFDLAGRVGMQAKGVAVASVNDQRWGRCDIKTVGLLPNVLAKASAKAAGGFEAWLVDDAGTVAEGASTNAWIVRGGRLITHPLSARILPGVMRAGVIRLARDLQIGVDERPFTLAEAFAADEAFLTATTAPVIGVVRVDGHTIGDGNPGPVTRKLGEAMWAEIARQTGFRPA